MPQDPLLIRPLAAAEQGVARALILTGLGEHFGFIDESLNPDLDDIAGQYLAKEQPFLSAWDGDRLVGTGCLVQEGEGVGRIVRMSVHQEYRRRGLGRMLVAGLLKQARERGDSRVLVETNRDWFDAIGLYKHMGFESYAEDEVSVYMAIDLS